MSFVSEKAVKAVRKAARCEACSALIEVGQPAVRWAGVTDGQFSASAYHPDCRDAEIALNKLHDTSWDPDDWIGLWDMDWEDWRWLLEEYPIVAARKGITLERVEETEREREETHRAWIEIDRKRAEAAKAARAALHGIAKEQG